jgi:hypothetical protein
VTRDGYVARWAGAEYEASPDVGPDALRIRLYRPDPADGFDEVAPDRYRRVVALDEVERLMYVTQVCTCQGEPFRVVGERGDEWLRVEYTGGQAPVAERLGLDRVERGVYQAWVWRGDARGLRDEVRLLR